MRSLPRVSAKADSDSKMQEVLIGGVIYVRGTAKPLSYFSERVLDFKQKASREQSYLLYWYANGCGARL
eukprot:3605513-Amphidinium_carterae.1